MKTNMRGKKERNKERKKRKQVQTCLGVTA
jgi:hypothetical protein